MPMDRNKIQFLGICIAICAASGLACSLPQDSDVAGSAEPWPGDSFGVSLEVIDDVDRDGVRDFVIADPDRSIKGESFGWIGAVSGKTRKLIWQRLGDSPGEGLGWGLSLVSDLNADGLRDIACRVGFAKISIVSAADGASMRVLDGYCAAAVGNTDIYSSADFVVASELPSNKWPLNDQTPVPHSVLTVYSGVDFRVLGRLGSPIRSDFEPLPLGPVRFPGDDGQWFSYSTVFGLQFAAADDLVPPLQSWEDRHLSLQSISSTDNWPLAATWSANDGAWFLGLLTKDGKILLQQQLRPASDTGVRRIIVERLGDVDGDDVADIFVGYDGADVFRDFRRGVWSGKELKFLHPMSASNGPIIRAFIMRVTDDLNDDSIRDVLVAVRWSTGGPPVYGRVEGLSGKSGENIFQIRASDFE